jgi:hypothetical protein
MVVTALVRRVERLAHALGDGGGDEGCPLCTGCFGPWREPPPSPCPTCGRAFIVQDFTLNLWASSAVDREVGTDD